MTKRMWHIVWLIIGVGLCSGLIRYQFASGYLLGCCTALLLYKRIESFWGKVLDRGYSTKRTGIFHFAINYALMAIVLVLCALYPKYLNIFACAIGMMVIKIAATIDAALLQGKEN